MSKINNGGSAFPVAGFQNDLGNGVSKFELAPNGGMTLRDKFADSALKGFCSQAEPARQEHFDNLAEDAYRMADAMLRAREKIMSRDAFEKWMHSQYGVRGNWDEQKGCYIDLAFAATYTVWQAALESHPAQSQVSDIADSDHKRLVRELDVLINGESGAAEQASLCDIVAQVRKTGLVVPTAQPQVPEGYQLISNETLRGLAMMFGSGIPDSIDNRGRPCQSQQLADLIAASQEKS